MKVKWMLELPSGDDIVGEIEVDYCASHEDIDKAVREDMWNTSSISWEIVIDGSALAEREACIKIIDWRIAEITRRPAYPTKEGESRRQDMIEALHHVAALIRARPT